MKYVYRASKPDHVKEIADDQLNVMLNPVPYEDGQVDEAWIETSEEAFIKSRAAEDGVSIPEETAIADEAAAEEAARVEAEKAE